MKKKPPQGYAAKHQGVRLDAELARALDSAREADGVSCEQAHAVAHRQNKPPHEAGRVLDLQNRPIIRCQLGLFGYAPRKRIVKPASDVTPDMADEIRSACVNGRLPCHAAWDIADGRGIARLRIAEACEALKIKISACQLGAF
ncbi:MAG: hypothetical protein QNI85_03725 [Desulfobacterales bacterium]|nr:hypothetical protein [Desulfobacterales bacterium]MDJ0989098.1 hypothetical protein [Desulfobacterales bacterium]